MENGIGSLIGAGGMAAASAIAPPLALAGAGSELFKLGLATIQGIRARKMAQSAAARRPVFTIPGAATNALNDQRNLAMGQAPGLSQASQIQAQNNAATNAAIMNSGGGSAERLGTLAMAANAQNQNALQMGAQQEQWKAQQMGNLINAQNNYANWQQQAWEYNRNKPYEEINAAAKDLGNASNMNAYDALKSGGGLLSSALKRGTLKPSVVDAMETRTPSLMPSTLASQADGDAVISDPDRLIQDPDGLVNNGKYRRKSSVLVKNANELPYTRPSLSNALNY